jgi:hypothetical protein
MHQRRSPAFRSQPRSPPGFRTLRKRTRCTSTASPLHRWPRPPSPSSPCSRLFHHQLPQGPHGRSRPNPPPASPSPWPPGACRCRPPCPPSSPRRTWPPHPNHPCRLPLRPRARPPGRGRHSASANRPATTASTPATGTTGPISAPLPPGGGWATRASPAKPRRPCRTRQPGSSRPAAAGLSGPPVRADWAVGPGPLSRSPPGPSGRPTSRR